MDIIWSSFAIIFLCTWSILHLSVPPQVLPPPPESAWRGIRRTMLKAIYGFQRKAKWMLVTIWLPEYILGVAVASYLGARSSTKMIVEFQREHPDDTGAVWTTTHSMYANLGGFTVRFPREQSDWSTGSRDSDSKHELLGEFADYNHRGHALFGPYDWKVHPQHYTLAKQVLDSGVFKNDQIVEEHLVALIGDVWSLSADQILAARRMGIIDNLPAITENEIRDKSKDDVLVKVLAVIQSLWLTIQLVICASKGRKSAQIEIIALAFAVCALLTYLLLLSQSKDVSTLTVLWATWSPTSSELKEMAQLYFSNLWRRRDYSLSSFAVFDVRDSDRFVFGTIGGLFTFGSIHLMAWDFKFPTPTEQLLWRIASLLVALLPVAWITMLVCFDVFDKMPKIGKHSAAILAWITVAVGALFTVPRFFLLVEAIRSNYYLPPSSYTSTWADNIPRFG